jgi:hypothetical protein
MFELFSGIDPFPGQIGEIYRAKMSDSKPVVPPNFPSALKDLILNGWSKEPEQRPGIDQLKSALNTMLTNERPQTFSNTRKETGECI